jgi:hypothetical protein
MASNVRVDIQRTERSSDEQARGSFEPERPNFTARLRRRIERLGPYQSLALLAVPAAIVEPLKLVAVAVAGSGHWISGTITVICAYAASLLLVDRLFRIVKPKLLTLPWFARLWGWLVAAKDRVLGWFR